MNRSVIRGALRRHRVLVFAIALVGTITPLVTAGAGTAVATSTGYRASFIPAGTEPYQVAVDPVTDTIYLTSTNNGTLTVVDGATGAVTATITLGPRVYGVAVDPLTDMVYVTERLIGNAFGSVAVINGATNTLMATIDTASGSTPAGIAVDSATNSVYVPNYPDPSISVIDGATNAVTATISTATGTKMLAAAVDDADDVIWATSLTGSVVRINGATNAVTAAISLRSGSQPVSVAINSSTDTVYAADFQAGAVDVIDGSTASITTTIPAARTYGIAVDPDSGTVYASSIQASYGTTWAIDPASNTISDSLPRGGTGVAVDSATGTVYEATDNPQEGGAWVLTAAAANSTSPIISGGGDLTFSTGQPESFTFPANALPAPTFAVTAGALPAGMTLQADGTMSGTPAPGSGGLYPVTIIASNGDPPDATEKIEITVDQPAVITSPSSATFLVGTLSSLPLTATGIPPVVQFSVVGTLPAGIGIAETPTCCSLVDDAPVGAGGVYPLTIEALDAGEQVEGTQAFTLTIQEAPSFTSAAATTFRTGTRGSFSITAHGYPAPLFTETGRLPAGVTLSPAGILAGSPDGHSGGVYPVTIGAANRVGGPAAQVFSLTVDQPLAFTSVRQAQFRRGTKHTFTFRTSGFPHAQLSERGRLPKGVTFRAGQNGTAVLAGDPARGDARRTYVITVIARNSAGSVVRETFRVKVS